MIWEIDDDCDKCVNWHEFQAMFYRCRGDKTGAFVAGVVSTFSEFSCYLLLNIGYEPRRFFNVVEFLLNDKDDSGSVSLEEATQILYLRFGKYSLDAVSILFAFRAREQCHVIFKFTYTKLFLSQHLQEIFGSSDVNNTRDLSLTEFLSSMEASHKDQIHCNASKNLRTPTS
jgi:calmodulin